LLFFFKFDDIVVSRPEKNYENRWKMRFGLLT